MYFLFTTHPNDRVVNKPYNRVVNDWSLFVPDRLFQHEVQRGEILEAVPGCTDRFKGIMYLDGGERREIHLTCGSADVFELPDEDAGLLLAIPCLKLRYDTFKDKIQHVWERLSLGTTVSVSVEGISNSVLGIVRFKGGLSSLPGTWFGVELIVSNSCLIVSLIS